VHRIIDVFPAAQQQQIRQQLALALNAIVCQQLVPRIDRPGRVPAVEVLRANVAVRNPIRSGKLQNLATEITLGKSQGMVSLEESLARLVRSGVIDPSEASCALGAAGGAGEPAGLRRDGAPRLGRERDRAGLASFPRELRRTAGSDK
jgi:Tfp pilus assembly pilus retraction ATPase PilT